MSRSPLDYAKVLADRVTGRSADVLKDTVLEYGNGGKSKGAASTPKPNYHEVIKSPTKKFIDVFYGISYEVSPTRTLLNAIRFLYSGAPGDAADKSWIQFASRQIIFEKGSKKWTPEDLKEIDTAAGRRVPVTHKLPLLWNVDSADTADQHYSFEVKYMVDSVEVQKKVDSAEVQMVDQTDFPASSAKQYALDYSKGEAVNTITMVRTMKTYLLRSDVAVWGCSWTSTVACRYRDLGNGTFDWWPDSNDYAINKKETGFLSALDEDHAKALLAENKESKIR